jgi:hypothetical protein
MANETVQGLKEIINKLKDVQDKIQDKDVDHVLMAQPRWSKNKLGRMRLFVPENSETASLLRTENLVGKMGFVTLLFWLRPVKKTAHHTPIRSNTEVQSNPRTHFYDQQ